MKHLSLKYLLAAFIVVFSFACTKRDGITNQPYDAYGVSASAGQLKINLAFAYTIDYNTLLIKINDKVVSNALQSRTPFPGGGYNTRGSNFALYLSVPQGANTVSVIIPKVGTALDSIVLFTKSITIPDNAPYTLHIADTLTPSVNNAKSLLVKNEIATVDTGYCRFRFVNMIPNVNAVDLYLNGFLIRRNIAFMSATDTFSLRTGVFAPGFVSGSTTTWAIRATGAAATSTAITSYASANGLQSERVLTLFSMGYASTTGTRAPFIALTLDKNQ